MTRKIYSVSYMVTEEDNGHCSSFTTLGEAEEHRKWLLEQGCFYVLEVWS
jgi:hypothetical protein